LNKTAKFAEVITACKRNKLCFISLCYDLFQL